VDKKKILVADDEPSIVTALTDLLTAHDYEVVAATTGQETLDQVAAENPDAILLDISMPVPDGLEVCRLLREKKQHETLAIIMLTGEAGESRILTALQYGADDYISKPFHTERLLAKVEMTLEKVEKGQSPRQVADPS